MNRQLRVLLLLHGLDKLVFFAITPNRPITAWQEGWLSESALALFFVIQIFCYRAFPLFGGLLADSYPRRYVILLGGVLQAFGLYTLCQAQTPATLFLAGALVGIGGGILNPAIYAMLSQQAGKQGGRAFSIHYVLINIGAMLGPLVLWPYLRSECLWLLLPYGLAWLWMAILAETNDRVPERDKAVSWLTPLQDAVFVKVFILFAAIWACYTMIFSSTPLIAAEFGWRPQSNVWLGINSVTVLVAFFWGLRKPTDLAISWRSIVTGLGLTIIGVLLIGCATNLWMLGVGIVALSVGELKSIPQLYHLVSEHAPDYAKSRYFGFIWVAGAFGEAGAQAILWASPNPRMVCITAAALLCAAMLGTRGLRIHAKTINLKLRSSF